MEPSLTGSRAWASVVLLLHRRRGASQSGAMKLTRRHLLGAAAAFASARVQAQQPKRPVQVFAAASLKTLLDEIVQLDSMLETAISYGGSGVLARQIALGAPADVLISADPLWIDSLPGLSPTLTATHPDFAPRRALFSNRLVLIAPKGHPRLSPADIPPGTRIAMGFVEAVPAGRYGKAALEALDLWAKLAPSIVQTENVRAALALVARAELPFGVVYASDAQAEPRVDIVAEFDPASHPKIIYELFVPAQSRFWQAEPGPEPEPQSQIETLINLLVSETARALLVKHGFTAL